MLGGCDVWLGWCAIVANVDYCGLWYLVCLSLGGILEFVYRLWFFGFCFWGLGG